MHDRSQEAGPMSEPAFTPAPLDSFAFARDGFLVLRNALSASCIDRQLAQLAAVCLRSDPEPALPAHPAVRRRRMNHALRSSGGLALALDEQLLGALNRLAGERCYLLEIGNPQSVQVLTACDSYAAGEPYLTAWIALRAQPLEAGLRVWPGSHLRNRQSLRRLLAAEPGLAERMRQMREEGASLEAWRQMEAHLLEELHRRAEQSGGVRLLALGKGDVLIQQQGLTLSTGRLDAQSCVVARYGAEQLHRNSYFVDGRA